MGFEKKAAIDFAAARPQLLKMKGISEKNVLEHLKLYNGYVNKYNEIMEKIAAMSDADVKAGNGTYAAIRELKVELTFAMGGVKNHEVYFANLGGAGGKPSGALMEQVQKDFGTYERLEAELRGAAMSARGWAHLAYDTEFKRLFVYVGDAQNTFPVWNNAPLLALDTYEHAYYLDYQTARAPYLDAFFANLDWKDVEARFAAAKKM
ncbi:MAG: superoxide dismutase [Candidatus Micrarchaeia archaeon]